jgi:hypothetical protein
MREEKVQPDVENRHFIERKNFMKSIVRYSILLCFVLMGTGLESCGKASRSGLTMVELTLGGQKVTVEVANTGPSRASGLMFRRELGENDGMLFVFKDSEPRSFWMKNTLIPLSVAFLDAEGRIINIEEMYPQSLQSHSSLGAAHFALEMNAGWFERHYLKRGDVVVGAVRAPASQD